MKLFKTKYRILPTPGYWILEKYDWFWGWNYLMAGTFEECEKYINYTNKIYKK